MAIQLEHPSVILEKFSQNKQSLKFIPNLGIMASWHPVKQFQSSSKKQNFSNQKDFLLNRFSRWTAQGSLFIFFGHTVSVLSNHDWKLDLCNESIQRFCKLVDKLSWWFHMFISWKLCERQISFGTCEPIFWIELGNLWHTALLVLWWPPLILK